MLTISNGVDNYNVNVATVKVCGMVTSDPVTLFGKFEIYNYYVEILFGTLVKQREYLTCGEGDIKIQNDGLYKSTGFP